MFRFEPLSPSLKKELQEQNIWTDTCPVSLERLTLITVSYIDFQGKEQHNGQIIVLDAVAPEVLLIFKALYDMRFPLAKIHLIQRYGGDDERSMADNNSSAFNHRVVMNSTMLSMHAYGLAIDINPVQNPYVIFPENKKGEAHIFPEEGYLYMNRSNQRPGMIEPVVDIFAKHGFFVWGGKWNTPLDWQHFQVHRPLAPLLAALSPDHAASLFQLYKEAPEIYAHLSNEDVDAWLEFYHEKEAVMITTLASCSKALAAMPSEKRTVFLQQELRLKH